jgi:hypothetical protein
MHFMQPTKNGNKAAGSRSHTLPCQEWRVDEAVGIEIQSGVIFHNELAQIGRHETKSCSERRDGLRGTGFPIRQAIRPGSAV